MSGGRYHEVSPQYARHGGTLTDNARLVVLDLSTRSPVRRYLLGRARQAAGGATASTLLLMDPNSRASGVEWGTARLSLPAEFITPAMRSEAQEWTHRVSGRVVAEGRRLFPESACDLPRLARLGLEEYLDDYATLAMAAVEIHRRSSFSDTLVLTTDRSVARALSLTLPNRVQARPVGRPRMLQRLLALLPRQAVSAAHLRRVGTEEIFREAVSERRPRVLVVVESTPMAQMFVNVERCLDRLGVVPRVRVDFSRGGKRAGVERTQDGFVLSVGRPDQGRPADPYRFLGSLPPALRAAETLENDPDLAWLGGPAPIAYWLENVYLGQLATIADQAVRSRQIIETLRPELVVVGNDRWWLGQSFVNAAREFGIPTLWVQDGIPSDSAVYFWMTADRMAASGDWLPAVLARHGIAGERCRVTGQPRYDRLIEMSRALDRGAVRERLGLDQTAKYALVATQPLQSPAYAREVVESLLHVPDLKILLRPHPSQSHEDLAAVAGSMPQDRVSFRPSDSVFDLLAACDLMVNQFSTVTIEAAILGRPVITANFSGLPDPVPYARFGLSTAAESMADISSLARRILDGEAKGFGAAEEGLRLFVGPRDGRSAERVAELIVEMLG